MKVYIEILIIGVLIFIFLLWMAWYKWSERRLIKKYKPENDKGRKGKLIGRTERGTKDAIGFDDRYEQPKRREFLPKTNTNDVRKNSDSNRKIRRILRRR